MSLDRGMDTHTYMHRRACSHTMDYYSARKRNKIAPFAEPWVELEAAIQNEVSQRETQIECIKAYMCRLKNGTDHSICKAETRDTDREQLYQLL